MGWLSRPVLLVGMLAALPALGFDKVSHRLITLQAAEIYCGCVGYKDCPPAPRFAQGAFDEDDTDLGDRAFNWHFYAAGQRPAKGEPLFETTLGKIFARRVDQYKASSLSDRWYRAGRVVHYIQDMAAPAHVVPVFHGTIVWPLSWKDSFDSYANAFGQGGPTVARNGLCPTTPALSDPRAILERIARETLNAIEQPILSGAPDAKVRQLSWASQFWCLPSQPCRSSVLSGFGSYRGSQRGESWGTEIDLGCGLPCTVEARHYRAFFRDRYRAAIRETIIWMAIVDPVPRGESR